MSQSDNLLPSLLPREVSGMEQLQFLLQHFGSAAQSGRQVLYPKDPPYALRVVFNKDGEPAAAYAAEALTPDALRALRDRIEQEFVVSAGVGVNRQVYFSMAPVRGWWRFRNQFQILPVPEHAPKAEFPFLDHPFLIEFRYTRSPDHFLDSCRRTRVVSKLALLLNALLVTPIQPLGGKSPGRVSFAWVMLPQQGAEPKIVYRQEAYYYDGLGNPGDGFSDVVGLPAIQSVPLAEYYRSEHRSTDTPVKVPSDLAESFDHFYTLAPAMQSRFLGACYWLSQANLSSSWSMTFLAAVQAIEALVDKSASGAKCPQCGLMKRPGATQQFASFLKRYVPNSQVGDEGRRLLYEVRSGLTHGYNPPFLMDTDIGAMLHPTAETQGEYLRLALNSARVALRNWLHAAPTLAQVAPRAPI